MKKRYWILILFFFILLFLWKTPYFGAIVRTIPMKLHEAADVPNTQRTTESTSEITSSPSSGKKDVGIGKEPVPIVLYERDKNADNIVSYRPQSSDEAYKYLQLKINTEPVAEFEKLKDFRFVVPLHLQTVESFSPDELDSDFNFIGVFADKTAGVRMFITYDESTGAMGPISCVIIKDEVFEHGSGAFEMRHDGEGYAVLIAGSKWFLRMKLVEESGSVVGHLFSATESGWNLVEKFNAFQGRLPQRTNNNSYCDRLKSY